MHFKGFPVSLLPMKTCPKCRRPYEDETLNFCLDDGAWLKDDDPAGGESTKILPSTTDPGEAKTRQKFGTTDETAVLPEATDPGVRKRRNTGLLIAAGAVIVAATGLATYKWVPFSDPPGYEDLPQIETERLTGSGTVAKAAISPDGKFLAYAELKDGKESMYVKQIETNSTVEILKEGEFENINNLLFSPDGNFVYFAAIDKQRNMSIHKVAALGGSPVPVPIRSLTFSLSKDGSRIAFFQDNAKTTETAISVAKADGSGIQKVISKSGKQWLAASTAWSPEGDQLAIVEGDDDRSPEPTLSLAIYSLKDGARTSLGSARWDRIIAVLWSPTGRFIYLTGNREAGAPLSLWRVSASTGETVQITKNDRSYHELSITSDGSRLVTTEGEVRTGVWVSPDLDPMKSVEVLPGRGDTWGLNWLPDGRIVYVSDQSGAPEVWVMNADGSDQKQLTNDRVSKSEPTVSRDGKTIAYSSPIDGGQLFTVPTSGGNPSRLETKLTAPANPAYSRDGNYLAFSAWVDGKQSIFRILVAGGTSERLTEYSAMEPAYSPDGSHIACYYFKSDEEFLTLGIIPAAGGQPIKSFEIPLATMTWMAPVWTPDGKQITFTVAPAETADLWAQPVDGGTAVRLSELPRPWIARHAYSTDGKRIAITRGERITDTIMLKGLE